MPDSVRKTDIARNQGIEPTMRDRDRDRELEMKGGERESSFEKVDVCHIWSREAAGEVGKMLEHIDHADRRLSDIARTAQHASVKGGFAAETLHSETFNLDAILKDREVRAFTDQHAGSPVRINDPTTDVLLVDGNGDVLKAQLKYYKNGDETHKAFRSTEDGVPRYKDADLMVGPADQLDEVHASARRAQLKNGESRPHVADAAREVESKATDRLSHGGAESKPLSKQDADILARGDEQSSTAHAKTQQGYLDNSCLKHSLRAAGSAALVTGVLAGAINGFQCLKLVQDGNMSRQEAVKYILSRTTIAAADSALKAGAATATVSITARVVPSLFQGSLYQTAMTTGALAGAAVCAVDMVECLVMVASGHMTMAEMETRTGKNAFQTTSAVVGSAIGAALGAPAGPVGIFLGSMLGGMIASLATTIAVDNHMEAAFRDAVAAASALVESQSILVDAVDYLAVSQACFIEFRREMDASALAFDRTMGRIADQSQSLRDAIGKL